MKSVIKRVLEGDWASLQADVDQMAAAKVNERIGNKKIEVLAKLNDVSTDKMQEIMAV